MSLREICERCDAECASWTVQEARIEVGGIQRKPHLCRDCTTEIEKMLRNALKSKAAAIHAGGHQ